MDIDVDQCTINIRRKTWPSDVIVNYNYGFSGEVGGGPYTRQSSLDEPAPEAHYIYVAKGSEVSTLKEALVRWNDLLEYSFDPRRKPVGIICILDNGLYEEDAEEEALEIHLPRGAQLTIMADDGVRPIIRPLNGVVVMPRIPIWEMRGRPEEEDFEGKVERVVDRLLHLNGLFIDGGIQIGAPGEPVEGKLDVTIRHCTLMPDGLSVQLGAENAAKLKVDIQHSIVGPLRLPREAAALTVQDSIVDHAGGYAIAAPAAGGQSDLPPDDVVGPPVTLKRTTIFGKVFVQGLPLVSEVIFTEPVFVKDRERGGVSFSYVPPGSQTPPCTFCQPQEDAPPSGLRPKFTSVRFGDPAYAQLSLDCPRQIRGGAADGSEMGAFHDLYQLLAEANMRAVLDEYLPLGLRAGIFYVT